MWPKVHLSLCCDKCKPSGFSFGFKQCEINILQMIWVAKDKLQQAGWEFLVSTPFLLLIRPRPALCPSFSTGFQPMVENNDATVCLCPKNRDDVNLESWSCHSLQWLQDFFFISPAPRDPPATLAHMKNPQLPVEWGAPFNVGAWRVWLVYSVSVMSHYRQRRHSLFFHLWQCKFSSGKWFYCYFFNGWFYTGQNALSGYSQLPL